MTRKRGMATAFAAACLVLAGCAGPLNLMQESIYCDDARIAQGFDTYTVAYRTGSLFDRKIGGLTGLETWLRISVPNEGGEFRVDYDATVSDGDFKIVFVDEKNVDTVCEGTARGSRVFTLDRGGYALKAVGAHASAEIAFELQASEGVTAVATGDAFDDDQAVDLEPIES